VLVEGPGLPREKGILWGRGRKVMGHSTIRCAKRAKPTEILFWTKTRVGPRNHVLDGGADSPGEGAIFGVVRAISLYHFGEER